MEKEKNVLLSVEGRKKQEEIFRYFHSSFPGDFEQLEESCFLVGELYWAGERAGMTSGYFKLEDTAFHILMIYIKKEFRTVQALRFAAEQFLNLAKQRFTPMKIIWEYEVSDQKKDPFLALMGEIPGYRAVTHQVWEKNLVDTQNFLGFRHSRSFYSEKTIQKKGYELIRWEECSVEVKERFDRLRENADETLEGLLPFEEMEYEPQTSMVLLEKKTGKIVSWMLCRELSFQCIEIRRWYTVDEFRKLQIGVLFGAYMLGILGLRYAWIQYYMCDGNDSMKEFTRKYFGQAIIQKCYKKYMEITPEI